ncbi:M48 family metalloprotease [Patescibacteria group bacterium]|nr:M48 family metalloprotease [Patescibacteria group bacterium]
MRLAFASLITISLLSGFLFTIVLTAAYVADYVDWILLLVLTVIINVVLWRVGPWLSDFSFKWFYRVQWIGLDGLAVQSSVVAGHIKEVCKKYGMKAPKIGLIPDDNPTAFCYGSGRFNARLVYSQGLFKYLSDEEAKAVISHELGHIVHRDFIVMTIAATILQLLYELYYIFALRRSGGSSRSEKKGNVLVAVGIVSYVFYVIGTYILLYLSRVREYYADEFAAAETQDPNALSRALVKVAYGIIAEKDSDREARLMQSTRTMGLVDFKSARQLGLSYANSQRFGGSFKDIFLFDLKNPWARILELSSTHPLTAKRIDRLERLAKGYGHEPEYGIVSLEGVTVDSARLWRNFMVDMFFMYLPKLALALALLNVILLFVFETSFLLGFWVMLAGVGMLLQTFYKYPSGTPERATVLDAMSNVYASPVRGRPVVFDGKVVGRGVPGLVFSEDLMMQDSTGLIYLNYESLLPFLGNLFFAWGKAEKLVGERISAQGWFVRGLSSRLELARITDGEVIKSHVYTWNIVSGVLITLLGVVLL